MSQKAKNLVDFFNIFKMEALTSKQIDFYQDMAIARTGDKFESILSKIANIYQSYGEYEKSLKYFERVLIINEKISRKENLDTATTYNNIAEVYRDQGEYEKAHEYYKKVLEIREKILGKEHPKTMIIDNNLLSLYRDSEER